MVENKFQYEEGSVEPLNEEWTFGFVTIIEIDGMGFCGGYLILNGLGHPREFHCSLPLMVTRTQQILYGARLNDHIQSGLIVPALLERSKLNPEIIVTDDHRSISFHTANAFPLVVIHALSTTEFMSSDSQLSETQSLNTTSVSGLEEFQDSLPLHLRDWPCKLISPHTAMACHSNLSLAKLTSFARQFCLLEPFQRIRDALSEAQSAAAA